MSNEHNQLAQPDSEPEGGLDPYQGQAFGGGEFSEEPSLDPLAGAGSSKKLNGGLMLLVAVVLIAVAGLFSMRKLAEVTRPIGIDTKIESTIETFLDKVSSNQGVTADGAPDANREEVILAVLSETYSERQVPLRDVQRNPFVIGEQGAQQVVHANNGMDPEAAARQLAEELRLAQEARRTQINQAAESLHLKAVMGGSRPVANIDGMNVRVGETVSVDEIAFRVTKIAGGTVELFAVDPELDVEVTTTILLQR